MLEIKVKQPNFESYSRAFDIINYEIYRRHHELVSKFKVGLNTFLRHGLSESELFGDLV